MTNLEEILQRAYFTARSFPGDKPPADAMYIGSRIWNGDRYRYWITDDGTLYQESLGEAELKRRLKRAGQL